MATLTTVTTVTLKDVNGAQVVAWTGSETYTGATSEYVVAEYRIPDDSVDFQLDIAHLTSISRAVLISDQDVTVQVGADNANTRALPAGGAMPLAWTTPATLLYVTN